MTTTTTTLQSAMTTLATGRAQIKASFIERDRVIDAALIAAIAREHVLLLGPPGTAKSELTRALSAFLFGDGEFFTVLATKFSTMEDFYGPISVPEMKAGRYVRVTTGKAWEKRCWFIDEIFKSSTSILNTLLKAMQERRADNGGDIEIPLEIMFAASNEYPEGDSLAALYDRFSFRFWVEYIGSDDSLERLLVAGGAPAPTARLSADEIAALRAAASAVPFGTNEARTLIAIKKAVEAEGFRPSDRTWLKARKLAQAAAVAAGRTTIAASDWRILADCLWTEHKDRARLATVIGNACDPYGARAEAILDGIRLASRDLPAFSNLTSGQVKKTDMINQISKVMGRLTAERDKLVDLEGRTDSPVLTEAREAADAALRATRELTTKVMMHRPS